MGKNKDNEHGRVARQEAARLRREQEKAEKRREATVRLIGGIAVGVVVVGIIGAAVVAQRLSSEPTAGERPVADSSAPAPQGTLPATDARAFGVPYGTAPASAPVLELWEDFQCPACQNLEALNGKGIAELAEEGVVQLVWRPTTFMDANIGNSASLAATAAWGCAIDQGKTREFHDLVYATIPQTQRQDFSRDQLIALGQQAGIEGEALNSYTSCIDEGTYETWAMNTTQEFLDAEIGGTPSGFLNGAPIETTVLADKAALAEAIAQAAQQGAAPSSDSADTQ